MDIHPNEIVSKELIGTLKDKPITMLRTRGGLYMATDGSSVMAAGSHQAIVRHHMAKQHSEFKPALMKSASSLDNLSLISHSQFLSEDLKKSGYDIYSLQTGSYVNFHLTKHGMDIHVVNSTLKDNSLLVKTLPLESRFTKALSGAIAEKALMSKANKVTIG